MDKGGLPVTDENGWNEYREFVLQELKRLHEEGQKQREENEQHTRRVEQRLGEVCEAIAVLRTKAGVWGALAGAVPVLIALAVWLLTGRLAT